MTARARKPARPADTPEEALEKAVFIASLEKHGQVTTGKGPMKPGTTHRVTVTRTGGKKVVRKRYSAV